MKKSTKRLLTGLGLGGAALATGFIVYRVSKADAALPSGTRVTMTPDVFALAFSEAVETYDVIQTLPIGDTRKADATRAFQRASGGILTVDGVYGPNTAGLLQAVLRKGDDTRRADSAPAPFTEDKTFTAYNLVVTK